MIDIDEYISHKDGVRLVQGLVVADARISHFDFGGGVRGNVVIEGVSLKKCKVSPGAFDLRPGVSVQDAVFRDLNCGKVMQIASEVNLQGVTISGGAHPKYLDIKPSIQSEGLDCRQFEHEGYSLDISDLSGEVSIIGVDVDKVKISPERHVRLRPADFNGFVPGDHGIEGYFYFQSCLKRIQAFKAREGIFDIPPFKDAMHDEAVRELEVYRSLSLIKD